MVPTLPSITAFSYFESSSFEGMLEREMARVAIIRLIGTKAVSIKFKHLAVFASKNIEVLMS
jgi:hypothetical protein